MANENVAAVEPSGPDKIWNAEFISLFLMSLTFNIGQNVSNQLMPLYADHLGASVVAVGVVLGAFGLSAVAFRFLSSPIMDTFNRKYVVAAAAVVMGTAFLGYSMSKGVPSLVGFRLVQGCAMAFGNSCSLAIVSDVVPKDQYGAGIGYFSVAAVISQAIGPPFGLWLVDVVGYPVTFVINAGFMLLSAFLAMRLKIQFKRTKKLVLSLDSVVAKEAIVPGVLLFFVVGGLGFGNSFLILHAAARGVTSMGLYFTVNALTMLATRPLFGRLIDQYGTLVVVLPALGFNVAACLIVSVSHQLWHFLAAAFVNAIGTGVCQPAFQTLSMKAVSSDRRGSASNTGFFGMDIGSIIGPVLGGLTVKAYGYGTMFRIQVIPYIMCMVSIWVCRSWVFETEKTFRLGRTIGLPRVHAAEAISMSGGDCEG